MAHRLQHELQRRDALSVARSALGRNRLRQFPVSMFVTLRNREG
jgi:hypothetical protein